MDEVRKLRYLDSRDLTGFIDGTENSKGDERAKAALIGDGDPEFAAGTCIFIQRYIHDLAKWSTLPVSDQEKIIGRRKLDNEELPPAVKPPTAHISRIAVEENGSELKIVRYNCPFGTLSKAGLLFIAYTRDFGIPQKMLSRMVGTSGDGLHDRLLDYTKPVSGATFFAPSIDMLSSLTA